MLQVAGNLEGGDGLVPKITVLLKPALISISFCQDPYGAGSR